MNIGVFPIRNHYYEPVFDFRNVNGSTRSIRNLPGINWNIEEQLDVLKAFSFTSELDDLSIESKDIPSFSFSNNMFQAGDAEYWYQLIRLKKPKRLFEIGSGNSTIVAMHAIKKNREEKPDYECKHVCIEPYEMPWLESTNASIMRKKVEDVELSFFSELEENDILFIDSSHIIKPEGDVLYEYLEILIRLNKGVIVHIHDIFSPSNYRAEWLKERVVLWNEQYLLEAFLSCNNAWKIIGALNYLRHNHYDALRTACPVLTAKHEPASFYIQKTSG